MQQNYKHVVCSSIIILKHQAIYQNNHSQVLVIISVKITIVNKFENFFCFCIAHDCGRRWPAAYYGRPWPAVYINFVLKIHQIQVLTEPLCRAQASMRCRTTNGVPNIEVLTYSARQNCPWILGLPISARQTRFRIWSVSIAVVRSIETPQTTQNHPKPHQSITVHIMR